MYGYGYSLYNRTQFLGSGGIDPSAQAFITATGITGVTQQTAINNLVTGLKADGLWPKMKAVYPFVTDNINRLSYTEDFSNAFWTKSQLTVTGNATTAPDGNTTADKLAEASGTINPFVSNNSNLYTVGQTYTYSVYLKASERTFAYIDLFLNGTDNAILVNLTNGTIVNTLGTTTNSSVTSVGNGWYRASISLLASNVSGASVAIGCRNSSSWGSYTGTLGSGVFTWGAQLEVSASATTYQPIATTQQAYIASQFKYNLVNPVDSDAAFRLVFNGGWTHSSTGATPNGTNGYADTKLIPSSVFSSNADNAGISVYQTNPPIGQNNGAFDPTTRFLGQLTSLTFDARLNTQDTVIYTIPYVSDGKGLVTITRNGTNNTRCYKNGTYISQIAVDTALTPFSSYVGARNGSGTASLYDNTIQKFLSYHNGLTDTQASNLYTRVQAFQTALSRQV